jgi:hypothetical protein
VPGAESKKPAWGGLSGRASGEADIRLMRWCLNFIAKTLHWQVFNNNFRVLNEK